MGSGVYCLGFSSFVWLLDVAPAREWQPSPLLTDSQLLFPVLCLEVKSKVQIENKQLTLQSITVLLLFRGNTVLTGKTTRPSFLFWRACGSLEVGGGIWYGHMDLFMSDTVLFEVALR